MGCITFYLHKWKELKFDMEVISTASGIPINIVSSFPSINEYQYLFNEKEDTLMESEIENLLKKES